MMHHEGQTLQLAAASGKDAAADYARGAVDGYINALIRLNGADDASRFSFALADRVVSGVRLPTAWPIPKLEEVSIKIAVPPPTPVVERPAPPEAPRAGHGYWTTFSIGFSAGVIVTSGLVLAPQIARWLLRVIA